MRLMGPDGGARLRGRFVAEVLPHGGYTYPGKLPKGEGVAAIYATIASKTPMVINPSIKVLLNIVPTSPQGEYANYRGRNYNIKMERLLVGN